jgi:IclR family pca regulon transcriptional regulator
MSSTEARPTDFVQTIERGLSVILAFDAAHAQLTVSDAAARTGLTRAAARRFLLTFESLGYLKSDGQRFWLQPRILELGFAYLSGLELPEIAQPDMDDLARSVHESCSLAIRDADEIVYVARVASGRPLSFTIRVGTRFPAYETSMGRVLLAAMPDDWLDAYLARTKLEAVTRHTITDPAVLRSVLQRGREEGYMLVDQELEEGLRSIAVPIHSPDGAVVAALNITAHATRGTSDEMRATLLPPLYEAARAIESNLRGAHWSPARL